LLEKYSQENTMNLFDTQKYYSTEYQFVDSSGV
jgi:hypothetical protein